MKLQKIKHELVVRIPLKQPSRDYDGKEIGMIDNLIGVIDKEYSISKLIDMAYAGKAPQIGMSLVNLSSRKELEQICKECDIEVYEYETCAYCGETIYGCHTFGKKGNKCMSCDYKLNK
jgi:hypothetical protein